MASGEQRVSDEGDSLGASFAKKDNAARRMARSLDDLELSRTQVQDIAVGKLTVRQRRIVVVGDTDLGDLAGVRRELGVGGMDQIRRPAGALEPGHADHMVAVAVRQQNVLERNALALNERKQLFRLTHSKTYARLVTELAAGHEGLSPVQQKVVEHKNDAWQKGKNISAKLDYEMTLAYSRAYAKWLEAKKANDYSIFRDAFADLIGYTRKAIDLRDEKKATYYDACLDDYEKGGSIAQLDAFFGALKERIVPLLARIEKDGKPIRTDFMSRPCPIPQQEAFSKYLLELEGLRGSALVLMTTEHPFTTNFGPHDVRVTTHYYEENFVSNIFTTLHEGGHALFMQNEPEEFWREHTAGSMSNAMHECISRFYENIIGRSEAFIHFVYPKLQEISGDTFSDVSERELYEAVNIARPSLIRTEADELTYSLHILIRYELEKFMLNGEITVDEIPALWNAKYKEYLGLDVPDDAQGCLQDVHWTQSYGYFPSYAL